ncbi:MAG: hypothetical protein K8S20_03855 [Chloroflexi bacterium]|nr:hypothetical protein [Chloroflexota bacterium]
MKITPYRIALVILLTGLQACTLGQATATPVPATAAPAAPTSIVHTLVPVNLSNAVDTGKAADQDSSKSASNNAAAGGDRFTFGEFERPFNANLMDVYFPYLDIQQAQIYQDEPWIHASIWLKGPDANGGLPGRYALEIDSNRDGKGDWLVLVSRPASGDWSTAGVQVWQDANQDVGGSTAMYSDENMTSGDGFELKVFEDGIGSDPDLAWARISPEDPNLVELSVKLAAVDDDGKFLAGVWAGNDSLNPAVFDFNDHMTHAQAGASVRGFEVYYPIKGLSELDNTCRVAVGFSASGNEPGLCKNPAQPSPAGPSCGLTLNICQQQGYCFVNMDSCQCEVCG